jgi:hypothetical protein
MHIYGTEVGPSVGRVRLRTEGHGVFYVTEVMRRNILGSHGGDYEEGRLLGCKKLVRTSQDTLLLYRAQPVNAM